MVLGGMCQNCGKLAPALISCNICGARVCHNCMLLNGCKICGGIRKIE